MVTCPEGGPCAACPADVTPFRSDARLGDTDSDRVSDSGSVGYLTGAGIVDPLGTGDQVLVLAGTDLKADTKVCPLNYCIEDEDLAVALRTHCLDDGDCASHVCVHPAACDDVQVLPKGTGVRDPRTVVAVIKRVSGTGPVARSPRLIRLWSRPAQRASRRACSAATTCSWSAQARAS